MNYRRFGKTDLLVSEIGFGAWAIGGPAKAGDMAIGWGKTDDRDSINALKTAFEQGINFFDTADFYGLGHSEELIGSVFGNNQEVIIATKAGQKPGKTKPVDIDYSKEYLARACEASLQRLKRDHIDYYQLHVANLQHLQNGECIEAMELLIQQGKVRYWGLSLSTFHPVPEAEFMLEHQLGHGFQLVFNIINQKVRNLFSQMERSGYGIIARMPLQFGLLTGKFTPLTRFEETDHRSFRLTPAIIEKANYLLEKIWPIAEKNSISEATLALSFILSFREISTTIPGIRTAGQALQNTRPLVHLKAEEMEFITGMYEPALQELVNLMQKQG